MVGRPVDIKSYLLIGITALISAVLEYLADQKLWLIGVSLIVSISFIATAFLAWRKVKLVEDDRHKINLSLALAIFIVSHLFTSFGLIKPESLSITEAQASSPLSINSPMSDLTGIWVGNLNFTSPFELKITENSSGFTGKLSVKLSDTARTSDAFSYVVKRTYPATLVFSEPEQLGAPFELTNFKGEAIMQLSLQRDGDRLYGQYKVLDAGLTSDVSSAPKDFSLAPNSRGKLSAFPKDFFGKRKKGKPKLALKYQFERLKKSR